MISEPQHSIHRRDALRISGAFIGALSASSIVQADSPNDSFRLAFGSCAKQGLDQPIWNEIVAKAPDLFLFLGDIVYADSTNLDDFRGALDQLSRKPGFQKLMLACPVLAVWDDHDYGINDGGSEHPHKHDFQKEFLTFFRVHKESPQWRREGLYSSHKFEKNNRTIQVIMLDTRFHRSPLRSLKVGGITLYVPDQDPHKSILGSEQWEWLDAQLSQPADVRIIASSIQVLPESHPAEKWGNLPRQRERLLESIRNAGGMTVIVSGDQHLGEVSAVETPRGKLFELTSSGLTHTREGIPAPNHVRIGRPLFKRNFGLIDIATSTDPLRISLAICDEFGQVKISQLVDGT